MLLLSMSFASAVCTVTMEKSEYIAGELAAVEMTCSSPSERNEPYDLTWYDEAWNVLEIDLGITPSTTGQLFAETYLIPNPTSITTLHANLTGTGLEGSDSAAVIASAGKGTLVLTDFIPGPRGRVGETSSISFIVRDSNNNTVTNAICSNFLSDSGTNAPITDVMNGARSYEGISSFNIPLDPNVFEEGKTYISTITCSCIDGTDRTCYNSNNTKIVFAAGNAIGIARTSTWLENVSTINDQANYDFEDKFASVCVNISNNNEDRLSLRINYNIRCDGSDDDLDRVLLSQNEELRGISGNTTQNQCALLPLNNVKTTASRVNLCYSATDVCVLNLEGTCNKVYSTTSPNFNYTVNTDILTEEGIDVLAEGIITFFIFLVGLLLIWFGSTSQKVSFNLFVIGGGIWWMGAAGLMLFNGVLLTSIFFVLLALSAIFVGIFGLTEEKA